MASEPLSQEDASMAKTAKWLVPNHARAVRLATLAEVRRRVGDVWKRNLISTYAYDRFITIIDDTAKEAQA